MKTNVQSKVKIPVSGFKRSNFNWSHDVNSTFGWGEVQPTMCKFLVPNSKTTYSSQDLIRLAPMVAPTFGRVKYKMHSQFVSMQDICPQFSAMMAQQPLCTGVKTQVPIKVPNISRGLLSSYPFQGSRATLYWIDFSSSDPVSDHLRGRYRTSYRKLTSLGYSMSTEAINAVNLLTSQGIISEVVDPFDSSVTGISSLSRRVVLKPKYMDSALNANYSSELGETLIVLGLTTKDALIPWDRGENHDAVGGIADQEQEVSFDGADAIVEFTVDDNGVTRYFAIAFEFSDLGKRLRKVIQGCGYQIDLTSTERVSVLPLLATYKAYWDRYGLELYQNWESTYCYKFIQYTYNIFGYDIGYTGYQYAQINSDMTTVFGSGNPQAMLFVQFMYIELANLWYTETPDFVGANIEKLAVSPDSDSAFHKFLSVDSSGITTADNNLTTNQGVLLPSGVSTGQEDMSASLNSQLSTGYEAAVHAFMKKIEHGEIDNMLLQRMYVWTNRNTLLGRVIADVLRAQGLGKFVDSCKSNYIGSFEKMITISDVVSMAATSEAILGEYGGRGLQYAETDKFVFENDEFGYWITLATIIPESGYVQGSDPTLMALEKFDFPHPDFDAVGMEITRKSAIVGCKYLVQNASGATGNNFPSFGFVPQQSKFKVVQNLVNGDFNRHNQRSKYLPYTLDKQLSINDYDNKMAVYTQQTGSNYSFTINKLERTVDTDSMPVAGDIWRIPTKFAWLGNFDRIFARIGQRDDSFTVSPDVVFNLVGFSDYNDDNFLMHSIVNCQYYAPMKPIEESYGVEDEDPTENVKPTYAVKA